MTIFQVARNSLFHYWRTNLVLAAGIAAATAVLTGALIVGDSMRSSLRSLALDRLGQIDEMIVSDGFFRQRLADELQSTRAFRDNYKIAEAAILFPNGNVETGSDFASAESDSLRRASNVNVFGISQSFWRLGDDSLQLTDDLQNRQVIVNQTLADQLDLNQYPKSSNADSRLTLRIPKPTQLPADSALGRKENLVESLVELEVVQILPDRSLGRFSLRPSQIDSPNIFVPIELLANALSRGALSHKQEPQANVIFLSAGGEQPPEPEQTGNLIAALRPALEDFGLSIKPVRQQKLNSNDAVFEYYSLSSDRLVLADEVVAAVQLAFPDAVPVFTYLANDIRQSDAESGIPFSMISAIDFDDRFALLDVNGNRIPPLASDDIVLNQWAAADLNVRVGDQIEVSFFEPESTHGSEIERVAKFELKAITRLAAPDSPFQTRRRQVIPAEFVDQEPTLANDPNLTPEVPGLTDAESIENWDLPFETAGKIRAADDDYWNDYRTTPKGFISLTRGQQLWSSRFGSITSFRIPTTAGNIDDVRQRLLGQIEADNARLGFNIVPIRRNAIAASSGSTPFDALFLALSMFVIASALILVSLLFRLTLNQRTTEIGIMLATGFLRSTVTRVLLIEMFGIAIVGAIVGILLGVAYAAVMIFGLKTWWLGAISKPVLNLSVSPATLATGAICGLLVCFATIALTIRGTRHSSIRQLLSGELATKTVGGRQRFVWFRLLVALCLVGSMALSVVASSLGGEPQAGAFMAAGFLVLAAALIAVYLQLNQDAQRKSPQLTLGSLASMSGRRNPLRSTSTIGLVAVASFLIVAVSSFRLTPTVQGTAGFDLIARSDQPIFEIPNQTTDPGFQSYSIRLKTGDDASCTNLYQSTQPQVLGVPANFIESFDHRDRGFRWASTTAVDAVSKANPWRLLQQPVENSAIPVVIDKNTANYSLKIFSIGGDYTVEFDSGQTVFFRVVGFLENSILQGSLIISEENFIQAFPEVAGYRIFLIKSLSQEGADPALSSTSASESKEASDVLRIAAGLESRYSDEGFDARSAPELLAKYQQVQNTYISTFQTLGALGLLLGTFGLAAVQMRGVLERRKELGLMRSVGFSRRQLGHLVLLENARLLATGLIVGIGSALVTTLPHYFIGGASVPWLALAGLFCIIFVFGLAASALASRVIARLPLIQSLRG